MNIDGDNKAIHDSKSIHVNNCWMTLTAEHIWKDRIHLDDNGIALLPNNFLRQINRKYIV